MSELPEPWSTAAEKVGARQTYRGIGDAAGLSHVTVRRLIAEGRTSPTTISKVASALRIDEATVYEWAGIELSDWGVWNPPAEAHRLNPRARAALEELIRAVTQDGGSGDAGSAEAEKSPDEDGGGAPSNVHELKRERMVAGSLRLERAADRGVLHDPEWVKAKEAREAEKRVGEESQDDGGFDPA